MCTLRRLLEVKHRNNRIRLRILVFRPRRPRLTRCGQVSHKRWRDVVRRTSAKTLDDDLLLVVDAALYLLISATPVLLLLSTITADKTNWFVQ